MNQWIERMFISFDGTELFYRAKVPTQKSEKSILVLHRGHEHSGRVVNLINELQIEDAWCFSFDLRGHGRSPGVRGWAPNFETWVKDLNAFAVYMNVEYGLQTNEMAVIANSVGSVMAAAWVHDYAPAIRCMVLAAPAFEINLYVPFALPLLRLLEKIKEKSFVTSYVRSGLLTRDVNEAKAYDADSLITKRIAVSVLTSLFDLSKRIVSDANSIEVPTMVLSAGTDYIVKNKAQKLFFERLSSPLKEFVELPQFRHAIFHEKDRAPMVAKVSKFVKECLESSPKFLPAVIAKPREHSVKEFEVLCAPPSLLKSLYYSIFKMALKTLGSFSNGIALGLAKGFDSGPSLDYVYQNKPAGRFGIGILIDKIYLSSIGWKGIRIRKEILKTSLRSVVETLNAEGKRPIVLDIAAGHGRYLFECASEASFPIDLHLRDIVPENLEGAKKVSLSLGITNATFSVGNAFKKEDLSQIGIKPNVIIISGLFELFENNHLIHHSLNGLSHLLQEGGYLIYTGQPWHPQLEMIARVLNNHQGNRWVMRRRIQAEMDELVTGVGLQKLDTATDGVGIFTVSISKKPLKQARREFHELVL